MVPDPYGRLARQARLLAFRARSRHLFIVDIVGMSLAAVVAIGLANDGLDLGVLGMYLWVLGIVVATRVAVDIRMGLYRHSWRFASVADMARIVACVAVGSAAAAAIVLLIDLAEPVTASSPPLPVFWVVEAALTFAVLAGTRFAIRAASDLPSSRGERPQKAKRALLYGAGWAGVTMMRSSLRNPDAGIVPVGFIDDDPDLWGRRQLGLRVYPGLGSLEQAVRETNAVTLLITMPNAPGEVVRSVMEQARTLKLEVRTVPAVSDLMDGSLDASRLRNVRVEDLLRRPQKEGHAGPVNDVFGARRVVITGAAGSIGSELARQVLALRPRRLMLVDRAESPLYLIQRELEERARQARDHQAGWGRTEITTHLVDVADRAAVRRLFELERPEVVLHAAAYKHVPVLEDNPSEAVQVNIAGTLAVIDAAIYAAGPCRLVLVSTDKAVWPSSVMGASKRVAEMLVGDAARRFDLPFASVRFGNVLGSNGSVVPIFQEQLEKGEPLTITDMQMTRYFMTIPEAAWLILDAAAMARPGDLFALDMGEPVKIIDLARDLARLAGRDPDAVPIKVTGLRKGEKLHEELFYDQELVEPTESAKVLRTRSAPPPADVREMVRQLVGLADHAHDDELRTTLHAYVRESVSREEEMWQKRRIAIEISGQGDRVPLGARFAVPGVASRRSPDAGASSTSSGSATA